MCCLLRTDALHDAGAWKQVERLPHREQLVFCCRHCFACLHRRAAQRVRGAYRESCGTRQQRQEEVTNGSLSRFPSHHVTDRPGLSRVGGCFCLRCCHRPQLLVVTYPASRRRSARVGCRAQAGLARPPEARSLPDTRALAQAADVLSP